METPLVPFDSLCGLLYNKRTDGTQLVVWYVLVVFGHHDHHRASALSPATASDYSLDVGIDGLELFAKVLVEEAVDDWVGAGTAHADDVADGVD